jgi:hypothetical protein
MDKQKQIEEMAKLEIEESAGFYSAFINDIRISKNKPIGKSKTFMTFSCPKKYILQAICIPEGAVVLTQEEWATVHEQFAQAMYQKEVNTRKETAEKFARLVEFHSVSTRDEEGREIFTISALGLKEILHEEFGIPYDEIAKEITEGKV